ncbi:MAG TPA: ricin-type beta-trefoil lectin domain protein [Streptosporangiaceae bacterium]|nr:ricin-type beta-trefoil lectin domain protein [Streptosporangiaceae bacterium]
MPAPSRRWSMSILCAAASLVLAGFSAAPAAAAPDVTSAVSQASAGPVSRSNVGATHSPQLLRQLSGSSQMGVTSGPGQVTPALTTTAAVANYEQGVDVSSWQHPSGAAIDWSQVAASGIRFAAVKATEGAYYPNPYALSDLAGAKAAGLSVVAYAFAIPNGNGSSSDPVAQADYLLNRLGTQSSTVPIMLDIEYNPYGAECYGLSATAMVSWISAFNAEIQGKTGRQPVIYTPPGWWNACTGGSAAFSQLPLWIPDYSSFGSPSLPTGWTSSTFWQYTSSGTVTGIQDPGKTDLDQASALLKPAYRQQTVGDPVDFTVQPARAPGVLGQTLTYTATGLPPGISLSSGGLITGWLTRSGKNTVKITANDAAGPVGYVSFTWAVSAAPDQGPTGPVRFNVGGKCLNDAGNGTTDGTAVNIGTCNGGASQQWTVVQDRTLRIHGKCLSISGSAKVNGAKTVLATCSGYASQQWTVGSGAELVNATAGLCLAGSSSGTGGVQAWISACNGKVNQKWTLPAGPVVSEVPGMCLNDQGASTTDGNPVVISSCDGQAAQNWTAQPDGTLRFAGKCLDIPGSGTASGTSLDLLSCNASASQQWRISAANGGAQLQNPASGLCLADPGDATANGTALEVLSCSPGDPGLVWRVR